MAISDDDDYGKFPFEIINNNNLQVIGAAVMIYLFIITIYKFSMISILII